jgi:hypothetical protein
VYHHGLDWQTAKTPLTRPINWHIESQTGSVAAISGLRNDPETFPVNVRSSPETIFGYERIPDRTLGAQPMIEAISATLALLSGGIFLAHIVNAYRAP